VCVPYWSAWINTDEPDTGDGEYEKMTDEDKHAFCPNGNVTEIECETVDGVGYYSSGEQLICNLHDGLACKNADNSPVQCNDYQVRYKCECEYLPPWYFYTTPTPYPPWYTGPTPTAYPPWYTGPTPTAYPPDHTGATPTAYASWYTGPTTTTKKPFGK
jgi:hypothetical protein